MTSSFRLTLRPMAGLSNLLGIPSFQKAKCGGGKSYSNKCLDAPIARGTLFGFGLYHGKRKRSIFSDHFVSLFWLAGNFGPFLHISEN